MEDERKGIFQNEDTKKTVHRESLNEKQRFAHDLFVKAATLRPGLSSTDKDYGGDIGRLQILVGQGGCGKSYVIKAIHITLSELNIEGGFFETTGMAAVGIGGSTQIVD